MTVDLAPNVLMIQLKRFEFSLSGHKISKKVGGRVGGCSRGWAGGSSWVAVWLGGPCACLFAARPLPHCRLPPCPPRCATPSLPPPAAPAAACPTPPACLQIDFDLELDLAPYMSVRPRGAVPYDLYAVLVHSGHSVHSGHYYAYVRAPNGIWHICDDTHVAQVGVLAGGWALAGGREGSA